MIDVTKMVENARTNYHDVRITPMEGGYTLVYRKKVKDSDLLKVAKEKLQDALECLAGEEALQGEKLPYRADTIDGMVVSLLGGHLTMQSTQDAQFRARAFDRVKEAYAILVYVLGEETVNNELLQIK